MQLFVNLFFAMCVLTFTSAVFAQGKADSPASATATSDEQNTEDDGIDDVQEPLPRIIEATLENTPQEEAKKIAKELGFLRERFYEDSLLSQFIRKLEVIDGIGSIDGKFELIELTAKEKAKLDPMELLEREPEGRLKLVNAEQRVFVSDLSVSLVGKETSVHQSKQLLRRIEEAERALYSSVGTRYHPFLMSLDLQVFLEYYKQRGYRDVTARVLTEEVGPSLVSINVEVDRGPLYTVARVDFEGDSFSTDDKQRLISKFAVRPGEDAPHSTRAVLKDLRRVRRAQCAMGYPRTEVTVKEELLDAEQQESGDSNRQAQRALALHFNVNRGFKAELGPIQVAGGHVPESVLANLPLQEGLPYCIDDVEPSRVAIVAYLRENGMADPQITVHERRRIVGDYRKVALTFVIEDQDDIQIGRIWYTGHKVTSERIIKNLITIKEGDIYRQSAVNASVQALRRSGLFKKVQVKLVDAEVEGQVFIHFLLEERDLLQFDVNNQRLKLFNLDLGTWPESLEEVKAMRGFRGEGQQLVISFKPEAIGFTWTHPFIGSFMQAAIGFQRKTSSSDAYSQTYYNAWAGYGIKLFGGEISILPYGRMQWSDVSRKVTFDLPIYTGTALTGGIGGELSLDLVRRDEERIAYFGLGISGSLEGGRSLMDSDISYFSSNISGKVYVPIWQTATRQHWVVSLGGELAGSESLNENPLEPHRRAIPHLRGYTASAFKVDYEPPADADPCAKKVTLSEVQGVSFSSELRIPLPFGSRNAIVPFFDGASVGSRIKELKKDFYKAAGLLLTFSMLNERIEGSLFGAYPFHSGPGRQYIGVSFGGNF